MSDNSISKVLINGQRVTIGISLIIMAVFSINIFIPKSTAFVPSWLLMGKMEYFLLTCSAGILTYVRCKAGKNTGQRIISATLGGILILLASLPLWLGLISSSAWTDKQTVKLGDTVLQQSSYSCGPASLATILSLHAIDISEAEAVKAAKAIPILGTEPDCIADAVGKLSAGDLKGQVCFGAAESIDNSTLPVIGLIRHKGMMGHYVVLLEKHSQGFTVGDPLIGKRLLTFEECKDNWRGVYISIVRNEV